MKDVNVKIEGNVNVFCQTKLWKALDAIHKEYGVNKSEILMSFIEHHFTTQDDLLVGVLQQVEKSLQDRLAQIQAAKQNLNSPVKPSINIVNVAPVQKEVKAKPVVKPPLKSNFGEALADALINVDASEPEKSDEPKNYENQDINFDQFRYKRYEDLEQIGMTLYGSKFLSGGFLKSNFKNGFFAMQAAQSLEFWRDGLSVQEICRKQPIQFENYNTNKVDSRIPTIQTMFRRIMKQIVKFGTADERAKLFANSAIRRGS